MIKILYNPSCPELIFAAALITLDLQKKYFGELCCVLPMATEDLNKDEKIISKKITSDLSLIMKESYEDFLESEDGNEENDKYILLGIFPNTKEKEKNVVKFFEKNEKKIELWIDWHDWSENLAEFLQGQSNKIHLEKNLLAVEILQKNSYQITPGFIEAEKAIIGLDMRNNLANRYLKILYLSRSLGVNNNMISTCDYFAFISSIDELVTNKSNEGLNKMTTLFSQMLEEVDKIKYQFRDDIPEFQSAKEMGRSAGVIFLNEVSDFFFVEEILRLGLEKYPWLCVVGYMYGGAYKINFASAKIPISVIVEFYCLIVKSKEELFKIINEEIIRA